MKKAAPSDDAFRTACSTLLKYIGNVARAPDEDKFRSINPGNAAFAGRVAAVPGALELLKLVGFEVRREAARRCAAPRCAASDE